MEFEEVREYYPGDDIRNIDWKVTARAGLPFIKLYREERELSVIIAADISKSTSSAEREKIIAEVGAVITLIALKNNDRVGLALFGKEVTSFYPPKRTRSSAWRILRDVMESDRAESGTSISAVCDFLMSALKTRSVIFLLSDFIDNGYEQTLSRLARKHDLNLIRVHDQATLVEPPPCIVNIVDPETNVTQQLDFSSKVQREKFIDEAKVQRERLESLAVKHNISFVDLKTETDFMSELSKLFSSK